MLGNQVYRERGVKVVSSQAVVASRGQDLDRQTSACLTCMRIVFAHDLYARYKRRIDRGAALLRLRWQAKPDVHRDRQTDRQRHGRTGQAGRQTDTPE
jgi:hypothetical protein